MNNHDLQPYITDGSRHGAVKPASSPKGQWVAYSLKGIGPAKEDKPLHHLFENQDTVEQNIFIPGFRQQHLECGDLYKEENVSSTTTEVHRPQKRDIMKL